MQENTGDLTLLNKDHLVALQEYLVAAREVVHTVWRKITGDWVFSVHAADLKQDGKVKIIAGSEDRHIYLLDTYGQILWSFETGHRVRSVYSIDLNHDGVQEIIAGSEDKNLYILDANGNRISKFALEDRINQVKAADLDGDGEVEIACGLDNGLLVVLATDGTRKLTFTAPSSIRALTLASAADSSQMVVVVGLTTAEAIAIDILGQIRFRYQTDGAILSLTSLLREARSAAYIALATANGKIALIDEYGREVWQHELEAKVYSVTFGYMGKGIDPSLVVGLEDQSFHVYSLQGQQEWSHLTEDWVLDICTCDINGDGIDEIIAGQGDSTITLYTFKRHPGLLDNICDTYRFARNLVSEIRSLNEIDVKNLYALVRNESLLPTVIFPSATPSMNEALRHSREGDFDSAISALVEIEQRGFSCEWFQSIGSEGSWLESLCSADINNDKLDEIIVACSDGKTYAFDIGGKLLWEFAAPAWFFDVCAADIDLDGQTEIISAAGDRFIYVLRGDGQLLRKYETIDRVWSVNCVDINGDGDLEIVAGLDNGFIQILSTEGELLNQLQVPGKVRDLRVYDLDNDGKKELIVSATDNQIHLISFADGKTLATYPMDKGAWSYRVRCQDIDGDGLSEIIATARDNRVHVLNEKCELKWKYYCADWIMGLGIADINGDGFIELILGQHDGFVSVLNASGDLCWDFQISSRVARSVDVGDWDKDGLVEFAIGTGNGKLFYFKAAHALAIQMMLDQCLSAKLQKTGWSNEKLIEHYLEEADPYLQSYAVRQLPTLRLNPERLIVDVVRIVEMALNAGKIPVIISCLRLICQLDDHQENVLPNLLKRIAAHRDLQVRSEVVATLDKLAVRGQIWATKLLLSLAKDLNPTLRRNVARVLKHHSNPDSKPIIRTLSQMCLDDDDWVSHEATRSLAHLCNQWPDDILIYVSTILSAGCDPELLREMSLLMENPFTRERLQGLYGLLTADIGTALIRFFKFLSQAQAIQTVDQITLLQDQIMAWKVNPALRAEFTVTSLEELLPVLQILQGSQQAANPADKASGLAYVSEQITRVSNKIAQNIASEKNVTRSSVRSIILLVLKDVLEQWGSVVSTAQQNISQEAMLKVQLRSKDLRWSEEIEIFLELQNVGKGLAWDIELEIKPSAEYEVVADRVVKINQLAPEQTELSMIRLRPRTNQAMMIMLEARYKDSLQPQNFFFADKIIFSQLPFFRYIASNPYLPGKAVTSPGLLFVGRSDVFQFIQEGLEGGGSNVLILTGKLRVGKTSILYQLEHILGNHYLPIFIDMQGRMEKSTAEFLFAIAKVITKGLQRQGVRIDPPLLANFQQAPGLFFIDDFLTQATRAADNRKLLLLIDEFGALETSVYRGLDPGIFSYMRSLFQHTDVKFILVVAESSSKVTSSDQWLGIFNIGLHKRVSLLGREATIDLVTLPVKGYDLLYDSLSLDQIYKVTGGHPFFVQSLCHNLVRIHNRTRVSYITIKEVSLAINKVLDEKGSHLQFMWNEWDYHQRIVLFVLSRLSEKQNASAVLDIVSEATAIHFTIHPPEVIFAAEALVAEEILNSGLSADYHIYSFRIDLIRRWISQNISFEDFTISLYREGEANA